MKSDPIAISREGEDFKARMSPGGKTVKCPTCDQQHGLWYRMGSKDKKSLCYCCDKQKQFWYEKVKDQFGNQVLDDKGQPVQRECFRVVFKTIEAPIFVDGLDIFTDWTPAKKGEHQKKNQHQLALMKGTK